MKKALVFAGLLSGALMYAAGASAESNIVEVKLTIDRSDPAPITYAKVQEKASRICLNDTHCKAELVDALVAEIADQDVSLIHAQNTGDYNLSQVASADRG